MKKEIIYGEEARNKLKAGVDKIANSVTTTLGPKGRNVAFQTPWGRPKVVHDGVTVAKEVDIEDEFENMGAQLAREASERTNDKAGDGTTTSMLLAQAIVTEGLRNVSAGTNPMALKKGLEEAAEKVVEQIKETAREVKTKEEKEQVATISAQDEKIGKLIAEAMEVVGDNGVVTFEEGKGFDLELEYKEGLQFERGFASPYFISDPVKMEAVMENTAILIVEDDIKDVHILLGVLEDISKTTKTLLIIANDFDDVVLGTLVANHLKGVMRLLAVKAPEVGTRRADMLEDIAIITGGTVISKAKGRELAAATADDLGKADRVVSTKDETVVIGGKGDKEDIESRVNVIKKQREESPTEFDQLKLDKRLAMISSGVAVINVGAPTESEMKEKKLRVEDAINATKAAVEEGIVAGGGLCLFYARGVLEDNLDDLGHKIIYDSLRYPITKILTNAGVEAGEVIAGLIEEDPEMGYDVINMRYDNMFKAGVIDPAKVVRSALQNAVSVATMVITTDCLIVPTEKELEKQKPMPKI